MVGNQGMFWKGLLFCSAILSFAIFFFLALGQSYALDVTLQWDANNEPDLAGYSVYYKTGSSGEPYEGTGAKVGGVTVASPIDMSLDQDENPDPDIVEITLQDLSNSFTYFLAVTAYDDQGMESGYSNEVSTVSSTTPTLEGIVETIPHHGAGIYDTIRVPNDTSFAVRIEDPDGIDITDAFSIEFTITVGIEDAYSRDIGDSDVVRIVKLTSEGDTGVTRLWAVYDKSKDSEDTYPFDTEVRIRADVYDRTGVLTSETYSFRVESEAEHNYANDPSNLPGTEETTEGDLTTITVVSNDDLNGFRIVYHNSEPIRPYIGPIDEIPTLDVTGITPVGCPVNLQPPTVFSNPVRLIMPCIGEEAGDLNLYLYNGTEWVYACSSYNTGGDIQPGGEGWIVPGSIDYDDTTSPPNLEIEVYHFSGAQAGYTTDGIGSSGGGAGGCFIATAAYGSPMSSKVQILCNFRDRYLKPSALGKKFIALYERHSPYFADHISKNEYLKVAVRIALWPTIGFAWVAIYTSPVQKIAIIITIIMLFSWLALSTKKKWANP